MFIEKDGKAERRVVKVGLSDDSFQEVTAGLAAGERVVIGPYKTLRHLKDGESISAKLAKTDGSDAAKEDDDEAAS